VADLVGLRFSVVHLRLAGYALLGVWANEIVSLLTTPMLEAVGTRLAYISQALDLSPLLLVAIGMVAFQGGLQRTWLERILLPPLLGLLPILSAIHFLMAPASIANAVTLNAKQEELSKAQLGAIETQLDRAGQVLARSADLEQLRRRLDAIPGIQVSPAPNASLEKARQDIRDALLEERRRVRSQIGTNAAQARGQFVRRSVQNAGLAVTVGLLLGWMRFGSMKEMELSTTYLSWVLLSDNEAPNLRGLKDLLEFQRACLATSYIGIVERLLRPTPVEEPDQEDIPAEIWDSLGLDDNDSVTQAPWEGSRPRLQAVKTLQWRRTAGMFKGRLEVGAPVPQAGDEGPYPQELPAPTLREQRRSQRDRERVREALKGFSQMVSDSLTPEEQLPEVPLARRPSARQLRKAREALERFAEQIQEQMGTDVPELQTAEPLLDPLAPLEAQQGEAGAAAPAGQPEAVAGPARSPVPAGRRPSDGELGAPYPRRGYRTPSAPPVRPNPIRVFVHWVLTHL
ncbi:MAG: hypothetical protein KGQ81_08760, partial [Cyanobacteria bacterium REEB498]|nr:hypothetical protein [Cyanobacteria bacterium REEB498]